MPGLSLTLLAIPGIPLIKSGDNLSEIILESISESNIEISDDDILVIAQKIVSKSEDRIVQLASVSPSEEALRLAKIADKDPRLVELILQESNEVIRCKEGVIIVEHRSGTVMANAGIDHSNVADSKNNDSVCLLPLNSDRSANILRKELESKTGRKLGIIINDSVGRAWRIGTVGLAIGCAGVLPVRDLRGKQDLLGHTLRVSETADADALASAACILMGEADDASPAVIIRGFKLDESQLDSNCLIRSKQDDMFR
jgi:coenzyme F420-0:L-glutamate ligase / coenzyme F420-1:gamma-L-glutamate ligase